MKITLDNVSKLYGRRQVVHQVSLSVKQGEIVGLLGPNGAGKTTSFYIATGLVQPDTGTVFLDDLDITRLPIHKRARLGMAYLAQEPTIFRHLSIRDNLLLVMEQTEVPVRQRRQRINQLLDEFRLRSVANSQGIQVSGGERRRTEIARALAVGEHGPKFLLLDEPFAGIDPIAVAEIQTIIAGLRDRDMGILITDHNVRETLAIIDRAYIMREGEILAAGDRDQLASDPEVRKYYLGEKFQF
ncbi:LPS export ABC transporter ATP-binding protein [Tumidithrix elongata RA019]|uniref:LPS export ABC transporter ATP-binding protein n=1 Tax=Tumidithrix elongata BACA0141 TaxID=2716417 RepID=A0AAW9Q256_9CYAN|nr:LPS export ABC transporter ATP-binding protein [Tumidithrix elongata RA019]